MVGTVLESQLMKLDRVFCRALRCPIKTTKPGGLHLAQRDLLRRMGQQRASVRAVDVRSGPRVGHSGAQSANWTGSFSWQKKAACKVRARARPSPTHPWRLTARKPSPTSAGKTERVRSAVASVRVRAE